jgi:AcrR family transcriptional regulator
VLSFNKARFKIPDGDPFAPFETQGAAGVSNSRTARATSQSAANDLIRRKPNQQRAHDTKEKVLRGTQKILEREGIEALTTRRLATVAGVSVGSIYEYFPSKQAVLYWVYEERLKTRLDVFDSVFTSEKLNQDISALMEEYSKAGQAAHLWSRFDLELRNAEDREPELQTYTRKFQSDLSDRYLRLWRAFGSDWPESGLRRLAEYGHEIDHLNMKIQAGRSGADRAFFGEITGYLFTKLHGLALSPFAATHDIDLAARLGLDD